MIPPLCVDEIEASRRSPEGHLPFDQGFMSLRGDRQTGFLEPCPDMGLDVALGIQDGQRGFPAFQTTEIFLDREVLDQEGDVGADASAKALEAGHEAAVAAERIGVGNIATMIGEAGFFKLGHCGVPFLVVCDQGFTLIPKKSQEGTI